MKLSKGAGNKMEKQNKTKQTNTKNQRRVQDYCKIQTAGRRLIRHKDHITDAEAVLDTPLTTMERMMEPNLAHKLFLWRKEQCSTEKSQFTKLTCFWVAQALTKKEIVSRPLTITTL